MAELLITIDLDGTAEIKVEGHAGPGCKDLTKQIERALGETVQDDTTPEYYKPAVEVSNHVKR